MSYYSLPYPYGGSNNAFGCAPAFSNSPFASRNVQNCCSPSSSFPCCSVLSQSTCEPISKLANFAHYGGRGQECCPPPYCPPPRCPPPLKAKCTKYAPPAVIDCAPRKFGKTPAERLRNVDVLEELCYYAPPKESDSSDPTMDCYCVCNCCGQCEGMDRCGNGNPKDNENTPVKYSRRQRFTFQEDAPKDDWSSGPQWPFKNPCSCPPEPEPCEKDKSAERCGKDRSRSSESVKCRKVLPPESGIYYFDCTRKVFIPQRDLPQPPDVVLQQPLHQRQEGRRQRDFGAQAVEEYELLEADSREQQEDCVVQPIIQPIYFNYPLPDDPCNQNQSQNNNNSNQLNSNANSNNCEQQPQQQQYNNPCPQIYNPCNTYMGMNNSPGCAPCGPCIPMCIPMCPNPPPQPQMYPMMYPSYPSEKKKKKKKKKKKREETIISYQDEDTASPSTGYTISIPTSPTSAPITPLKGGGQQPTPPPSPTASPTVEEVYNTPTISETVGETVTDLTIISEILLPGRPTAATETITSTDIASPPTRSLTTMVLGSPTTGSTTAMGFESPTSGSSTAMGFDSPTTRSPTTTRFGSPTTGSPTTTRFGSPTTGSPTTTRFGSPTTGSPTKTSLGSPTTKRGTGLGSLTTTELGSPTTTGVGSPTTKRGTITGLESLTTTELGSSTTGVGSPTTKRGTITELDNPAPRKSTLKDRTSLEPKKGSKE